MKSHDQKCDVFKISNKMVKINQDIVGEHCTRNDDGVFAVSGKVKKIASKSFHEKHLNIEFAWDRMGCLRQIQLVFNPA